MGNKLIKKMMVYSVVIIMLLTLCPIYSYADDEDDEGEDLTNQEIQEELSQASAQITNEPKINSRRAVIYDRISGTVLYGKEENKKTAMASTTKIMTCLVVLENSNLTDIVTVTQKAALTGGSRLGLKTNDKITVNDLLYGLMMKSRK